MRGARVLAGAVVVGASLGACSVPFADQIPVVVTVTPTAANPPDPAPRATASRQEPLALPFVSGSRSWTDVAKQVSPAVVRIDVAGCDTRVVGSGFFIADDLVVTAGHVVSGATALSVQYAGGVVPALVVGIDRTSDTAMIRTARPVAPKSLRLAAAAAPPTTTPPATPSSPAPPTTTGTKPRGSVAGGVGSSVGILGYPNGTFNLHATEAGIVGVETVDYGATKVEQALETDASITDGNTGGPVVDQAGNVVGLVTGSALWISGTDSSIAEKKAKSKGLNRAAAASRTSGSVDRSRIKSTGFVVPAAEIATDVERWRDSPNRDLLGCYADVTPVVDDPFALTVDMKSGHSYARDVAAALALHGQAINGGSQEVAYEVLTPRLQAELKSLDAWRTALGSTHWVSATIVSMVGTGNVVEARVTLRTTQAASDSAAGQKCSVWDQSYTLRTSGGGWLIDRIRTEGAPTAC